MLRLDRIESCSSKKTNYGIFAKPSHTDATHWYQYEPPERIDMSETLNYFSRKFLDIKLSWFANRAIFTADCN